jgi:hypothetical protein
VIVIDEYLAVRGVGGDWPAGLPDDEDLVLTAGRHWRLLQRIHAPGTGQLSQVLARLSAAGRDGIRHPHPGLAANVGRPLAAAADELGSPSHRLTPLTQPLLFAARPFHAVALGHFVGGSAV